MGTPFDQHRRYLPVVHGTSFAPRPTTLSARAARELIGGPMDAVTLMRRVCQVERLQREAAERMAVALLGHLPEFEQCANGFWALRQAIGAGLGTTGSTAGLARVGDSSSAPDAALPTLRDVAFAVVDVETTGTSPSAGDRVTEIAVVQVQGGEVGTVYSRLVNPQRPIPPHITALTQISWVMVRDQPPFCAVADEVRAQLAGRVFVAHNAAFDWRFVSDEFRRADGAELHGPRLCTVRMARRFLPDLSRRSLDEVTRYLGVTIDARHRAAGDAVATAHALCRMLVFAEREGIQRWAELEAVLARPMRRPKPTAVDRRRRAFPLPVTEDTTA